MSLASCHGKRGLIMGVANDHSIAWGIAKAPRRARRGTRLHLPGRFAAKRVEPLAASVGSTLLLPCDVEDLASVDAVFARTRRGAGASIDFLVHAIAFSDKNELKGRYADTSRENFSRDDGDLLLLLHGDRQARRVLMTAGGSMVTLTYGGSTRVMPNYNVMGVAKAALEAVGALPCRRLRRRRTSGSTRSRPGRCGRWRAPASPMRG